MILEVAPVVPQAEVAPVAQLEPQMISYESHRKLLDEKKKVQGELSILLADKKARDESEAVRRGDFESLLKSRDEELAKERGERQQLQNRITTGLKMNAVIDSLGGNIDPKWYQLIDTSEVVQSETGELDPMTVARVSEALKKQWPEMVKTASKLPTAAPQGLIAGGTKIAESEWKNLTGKQQALYGLNDVIWGY